MRKKIQLAKNFQNESFQLQMDKFRPLDEENTYNLEYIINRLNGNRANGKIEGRKVEPLRGYENLSPNRIK